MIPQIKFQYNKKTTSLDLRIKLYGTPAGVYSTGISVDEHSFDEEKQICGDVSVMAYIKLTKESLERAYRPGQLPDQMWSNYLTSSSRANATLNEAFEYYLFSRDLAEATKYTINNLKSKVEAAGIINTPLDNITPAMVRLFMNNLEVGQSTKIVVLKCLKSVINHFVKDHNLNIRVNLDGIVSKVRSKTADEQELEYLTFAEVKNLIDTKTDDKKLIYAIDIFLLMCFTGLSVGDIVRFTPASMISADGKWIRYRRTKTMKKGRQCQIPMLPITRSIIYKHEWPIKITKRTIQWYCQKQITKLVGKRVTAHTSRHTFGGLMLYFGFSMESVREMMGHSSVAITEQIYAKVTKEKIEREMRDIPKRMNELLTQTI
jgi:site-specific recombinase XerD